MSQKLNGQTYINKKLKKILIILKLSKILKLLSGQKYQTKTLKPVKNLKIVIL